MKIINVDENSHHVKQLLLDIFFFLQQPSFPFYLQAFKPPGRTEPRSSISAQAVNSM